MKYSFVLLIVLSSFKMNAQNVGVGTTTPVEKLDVNGNINVTGTIKANGTDGQPNQALMKNASGVFVWGDLCSYKDKAMFNGGGIINWTVPANVRRILVEAWGAGGGGSSYAGGGGGAYVAATFTVTPGDLIVMDVGIGGTSGSGATAGGAGGPTLVTVGAYTVTAGGGSGAGAATQIIPVYGGVGTVSGTFENYITVPGGNGKNNEHSFTNSGASTYEILQDGEGGSGGNSVSTGGAGNYRIVLTTSPLVAVRNRSSEGGKQPGGGGGGGYVMISGGTPNGGNSGAYGVVVFHY